MELGKRSRLLPLLLLLQLLHSSQEQRVGLPLHHFANQPFAQSPIDLTRNYEIDFSYNFVGKSYNKLLIVHSSRRYLCLRSPDYKIPAPIPPFIELMSKSDSNTQVFVRELTPTMTSCRDSKMWRHYERLIAAAFSDNSFRALRAMAVMLHQSRDAALGSLAEVILISNDDDTYAIMNFANCAGECQGRVKTMEIDTSLPSDAVNGTNTGLPGRWVLKISSASVESANFGEVARQVMEAEDRKIGFGQDGIQGCSCSCHANATCDLVARGKVSPRKGSGDSDRCCHCSQPLLGNGVECLDRRLGFGFSSAGTSPTKSSMQVGASGMSLQVSSADKQHSRLLLLSADAVAAAGLLLADPDHSSSHNLFRLADVFERQLSLELREATDSARLMGRWRLRQRISNRPLLKTISTEVLEAEDIDAALLQGQVGIVQQKSAVKTLVANYSSSRQQQNVQLRTVQAVQVSLKLLRFPDPPLDLLLSFNDSWKLQLTCSGEYVVPMLSMQLSYSRDKASAKVENIMAKLKKPPTCADISCGDGRVCRDASGVARCECPDGLVEDLGGSCRPGCGGRICDADADCVAETCVCRRGLFNDAGRCRADTGDCRLAANSCPSGHECRLTAGASHRCHCVSSMCKRSTDCERFNCSTQAAVCKPGECVCPNGFTSQQAGRLCLPDSCTSSEQCRDLGAQAFCSDNATCVICQLPAVVTGNRCVLKPCTQDMCHRFGQCQPDSRCQCRSGFVGDGYTRCERRCSSVDDCQPSEIKQPVADLLPSVTCNSSSSTCQCRPGYRAGIDAEGRTTCSNCRTDADCMRGAACESKMVMGAMRCQCPHGQSGDGKTRCDECSASASCGQNAECDTSPSSGSVCKCRFGHSGQPRTGCQRDPTVLELSPSAWLLAYENQENVTVSCKVVNGPTPPQNVTWSREPADGRGEVSRSGQRRVSQFEVDARLILQIRRVLLNDTKFFCIADRGGRFQEANELQLDVRPDPCPRCHMHAFCNYSKPGCQCGFGFVGNGVDECGPANCLQQPRLCDASTQRCLFVQHNATSGGYECQCLPGMRRADGTCARPPGGCLADADCHDNATCELVHGARSCRCRQGFSGDGKRSCAAEPLGCNEINRCAAGANCRFSPADSKFRCVCEDGFLGIGDSLCMRDSNCSQCDPNAVCRVSKDVQHSTVSGQIETRQLSVCKCKQGFATSVSAGRIVCRSESLLSTELLVAKADMLLRVSDSSPGVTMSPRRDSSAAGKPIVSLSFDCFRRRLLWSALGHDGVMQAESGQYQNVQLIAASLGEVEGLAVDWLSGNIFYTARRRSKEEVGQIGVIREHKGRIYHKILLSGKAGSISKPRGIAVDPFLGKLYFTDWNPSDPKVESMFMNGEQRQRVASPSGLLPNGIVRRFDSDQEEVCFVASGARGGNASLECVDCSKGSRRQMSELSDSLPYGLTYSDRIFYWTDWQSGRVQYYDTRARASGTLTPSVEGDARPMGIAAAVADCPSNAHNPTISDSACSAGRNYGNCRYLCLNSPGLGAECACPDDQPDCIPNVA